jgi:hypothetical protein
MTEHEFPYESFIGGWYIPESICDDLIKLFLSAREKGHTVIGLQKSFNKVQVDKTRKDSEELFIKWNSTNDLILKYRVELQKVIENYAKKYDAVNYLAGFNVNTNYNLQYYKPEGGFKVWHNERSGGGPESKRVLVFMTYLNDVDDGGTEFLNQNIICPAKKGLTIIWPTDWTHTHRGQVSMTKEKYIVTGWFSFNE